LSLDGSNVVVGVGPEQTDHVVVPSHSRLQTAIPCFYVFGENSNRCQDMCHQHPPMRTSM